MFGDFIKKRRLELNLSLRAFCLKTGEDPSNWSKMERGILGPPEDYTRLLQIARNLEFEDGSEDSRHLFDLASADRGRIPPDIMNEAELVANLPAVFRTMRGESPTEEELIRLAEIFRRERTKR
ncbi:MAG: helix-turn-helix transcriptional regulator [Candidatus Sumerlaeota bacterium]|nr:helix-turn-helix transcriptional regulator [Candidatus Sumerlaeota bacterium]